MHRYHRLLTTLLSALLLAGCGATATTAPAEPPPAPTPFPSPAPPPPDPLPPRPADIAAYPQVLTDFLNAAPENHERLDALLAA